MKHGWRPRRGIRPQDNADLESALDAMTAEELRSFVRDALERLDDEPRGQLMDAVIARAAKGSSGWRPENPSGRIVDDVKRFVEAARRIGYAEPQEVDAYLREGTKAFLAGDHTTARGVFETLLPPIADADIDLGQHEMVDEVLSVDVHECAARYVVSVYVTTPVEDRAEALCRSIDTVHGVGFFWQPLEQMERVATAPLPDFDEFLPRWVRHLEGQPPSESEWEGDRDRWLREAVLRLEGVTGLERIARRTKKPEALRAWCTELADRGQWAEALRAFDAAAELVGKSHWRGDFLDGAALAAQQLGRRDTTERLEAAWLGHPSLVRLLRWLGAGAPAPATVVKRTRKAIAHCPPKAARQLGLLRVLSGDVRAAAKLLADAPGLGWSSEDHPGHLLFSAFAGLLAEGANAPLSAELFAGLSQALRDPFEAIRDGVDDVKPKLTAPSVAELIMSVRAGASVDSLGRMAMFEAMQVAATGRVGGVLDNKRRGHYAHAARLVACCLELSPVVEKQKAVAGWIDEMRRECARFSAFQKELKSALASTST
jgi:hypothetical protein